MLQYSSTEVALYCMGLVSELLNREPPSKPLHSILSKDSIVKTFYEGRSSEILCHEDMNKVCWFRPEVVDVCLVVTEVVQQLLTVHIAVSSKYKYLSSLSLSSLSLLAYPLASLL